MTGVIAVSGGRPANRAPARFGVAAVTMLAPAAWGTTYLVTTELLPEGRPMLLAAMRALPAGLLLLLLGRKLPRGKWWGRSVVLGMLNVGFFFPLLFVGAYRLPGGVAATIGAIQPLLVIAFSALILGARPSVRAVVSGLVGVVGVALLVLNGGAKLGGVGVAAMLAAIVLMSLGTVLARKWGKPDGVTMLDLTAWQLTAAGLFLAPLALVTEGAPPALTGENWIGFAYLGLFGTALAYVLFFRGIEVLGAGPVSFMSLVNPAVATLGGIVVLDQTLTPWQIFGLVLALGAMFAGQAPARPRKNAVVREGGPGTSPRNPAPLALPAQTHADGQRASLPALYGAASESALPVPVAGAAAVPGRPGARTRRNWWHGVGRSAAVPGKPPGGRHARPPARIPVRISVPALRVRSQGRHRRPRRSRW
ncbi:DMT family transporter [Yinghuangia sp. ASG 101]|uniref:EamA family transporter n=1 Tax=Yinghuangia sp. ASG 101 TaxID=2896848 RepID=UPI001E40EB8D|nr:EamA family transporter [Yinghuangia sp. ASG 101]UGQ14585.1 DMT family transporter [Yinghuangia sp. ASG 101]